MTRKEAAEYRYLAQEISLTQRQLSDLKTLYYAAASNDPQTLQEYNEIRELLEARIAANTARCEGFERWLSSVSDPLMAQWLYMRYVDGLPFKTIAALVNGSAGAIKIAIYRCFEKEALRDAG